MRAFYIAEVSNSPSCRGFGRTEDEAIRHLVMRRQELHEAAYPENPQPLNRADVAIVRADVGPSYVRASGRPNHSYAWEASADEQRFDDIFDDPAIAHWFDLTRPTKYDIELVHAGCLSASSEHLKGVSANPLHRQ